MRLLCLPALLISLVLQAQLFKTNIHFAAKNNPNKELKKAVRLSSNDTETSQKAFQMEGPAWENDLVAFRNYFDARNGIDIWGKRTNKMVLDSVGLGKDYHKLDWWGMDILHVGNSLGAGAIALMIGDSIYRIGPGCKGTYKLVGEKPYYCEFQLKFEDWKVQDRVYTITHTISIFPGTRFYQSTVKIDGIKGDEFLISGIVNLHSKDLYVLNENGFVALATHDKQAFDGEYLGMAIMLPKHLLVDTITAPVSGPGITNTFMAKMKLDEKNQIIFRFYSCWEYENASFAKRDFFKTFLYEEMKIATLLKK
jgi:hypothetical protein